MKVRSRGSSLIRSISGGLYKSLAIRTSELMARVRDESRGVVYKEIVKETVI